jgi:phage shock protein A
MAARPPGIVQDAFEDFTEEDRKMPLINRLSRLVSADLNAVLDRLEEPGILLKQAVRDMEAELVAQEREIKRLKGDRDRLGARAEDIERTSAEIDAQLDLCFTDGNETLAKKLISRKLRNRRLAKRLAADAEAIGAELDERLTTLDDNRDKLESMRQKADCFAAEQEREDPQTSGIEPDWVIGDDEVEAAFLAEKARRSAS